MRNEREPLDLLGTALPSHSSEWRVGNRGQAPEKSQNSLQRTIDPGRLSTQQVDSSTGQEWRVAASEVSIVGQAEAGQAEAGQAEESALVALNERISRLEGFIVSELASKIQQALVELPTKEDMAEAVNKAVKSATSEVAAQVVEPLVEEVAQLEARHAAEMQQREAQHAAAMKELMQSFDGLRDEIARQNEITEERLAKAEEKKELWWWPWK